MSNLIEMPSISNNCESVDKELLERIKKLRKTFRYPSCWQDDHSMAAMLKSSPEADKVKFEFWQDLIRQFCEHKSSAIFSKDELMIMFECNECPPLVLDAILEQMLKDQSISVQESSKFEDDADTWSVGGLVRRSLGWGLRKIRSSMSTASSKEEEPKSAGPANEYVHEIVLGNYCRSIEEVLKVNSKKVCSLCDFKDLISKKIQLQDDCLTLCLQRLKTKGRVDLKYSGTPGERRIVKVTILKWQEMDEDKKQPVVHKDLMDLVCEKLEEFRANPDNADASDIEEALDKALEPLTDAAEEEAVEAVEQSDDLACASTSQQLQTKQPEVEKSREELLDNALYSREDVYEVDTIQNELRKRLKDIRNKVWDDSDNEEFVKKNISSPGPLRTVEDLLRNDRGISNETAEDQPATEDTKSVGNKSEGESENPPVAVLPQETPEADRKSQSSTEDTTAEGLEKQLEENASQETVESDVKSQDSNENSAGGALRTQLEAIPLQGAGELDRKSQASSDDSIREGPEVQAKVIDLYGSFDGSQESQSPIQQDEQKEEFQEQARQLASHGHSEAHQEDAGLPSEANDDATEDTAVPSTDGGMDEIPSEAAVDNTESPAQLEEDPVEAARDLEPEEACQPVEEEFEEKQAPLRLSYSQLLEELKDIENTLSESAESKSYGQNSQLDGNLGRVKQLMVQILNENGGECMPADEDDINSLISKCKESLELKRGHMSDAEIEFDSVDEAVSDILRHIGEKVVDASAGDDAKDEEAEVVDDLAERADKSEQSTEDTGDELCKETSSEIENYSEADPSEEEPAEHLHFGY